MLRFLPLLLALGARVNFRHLKLAVFALMSAAVALAIGVGYLAWGWAGAVVVPLVGVLFLHIAVRLAVSYGMRAHGRGHHGQAVRVLWLTQVPFLRLYDRRGGVSKAFQESKSRVTMELMAQLVGQQFIPRQ